jgi:hypothetical protein
MSVMRSAAFVLHYLSIQFASLQPVAFGEDVFGSADPPTTSSASCIHVCKAEPDYQTHSMGAAKHRPL